MFNNSSYEDLNDESILSDICAAVLLDFNYMSNLPYSIRNDVLWMREIAKTDGVDSAIQFFVLDDVQNDLEFHLNLLQHGNLEMSDYVSNREKNNFDDECDSFSNLSHFTNSFVGLNVRMSRLFWETLNQKLIENHYSPYDVENEIRIAKEENDSKDKKKKRGNFNMKKIENMEKYNIYDSLGLKRRSSNELYKKLREIYDAYRIIHSHDEYSSEITSIIANTFSSPFDPNFDDILYLSRVSDLYDDNFYGIEYETVIDYGIEKDACVEFLELCYWYVTYFLLDRKTVLEDLSSRVIDFNKREIERLEEYNKQLSSGEMLEEKYDSKDYLETITLVSSHPESYGDEVVSCLKLDSFDKVDAYLHFIPESSRITAKNNVIYDARPGMPNEVVDLSKKVFYNGKEYVLESKSEIISDYRTGNDDFDINHAPIVLKEVGVPVSQNRIFDDEEFASHYEMNPENNYFVCSDEEEEYIQVKENLMIGDTFVLAGSYVPVADLEDYSKSIRVVPKEVFESSYQVALSNPNKAADDEIMKLYCRK